MSDYDSYNELECKHNFFLSKVKETLSFCKNCGIIKYKNCKTTKTQNMKYSCELDQNEVFKMMSITDENFGKLLVDYQSDYHKEYILNRKYFLEFLNNLMDVHKFRMAVFFLAVSYLDYIILNNSNINFTLTTYACFLLASKFYEYDPKLISMKQLKNYNGVEFTEIDIKKSEIICLKLLNYKLDRISSYDYLEFFLKNGIVFEEENLNEFDLISINNFAYDILSQFINDSRYLDFSPLEVTCAVISYVREKFRLKQNFSKKFYEIYEIKSEDYLNCYFVIKTLYSMNNNEKEMCMINFDNIFNNDFNNNGVNNNFNFQNNNTHIYSPPMQNLYTNTPTLITNNNLYLKSQNSYSDFSNYYSNDSALNSTREEESFYYPVNTRNNRNFSKSTKHSQTAYFNNLCNKSAKISPFSLNTNKNVNFTNYYNNYYMNTNINATVFNNNTVQ